MRKLVSGAHGIDFNSNDQVGGKIYFPNVAHLRNKRVKHISIDRTDVPLYFTFVEQNTQTELIKELPASLLHFGNEPLFINKIIDLQNSYITIPSSVSAGTKFNVVFWYDEPDVWGFERIKDRTEILPLELTLSGSGRSYFSYNAKLAGRRVKNLIFSNPVVSPNGNICIKDDNGKYGFARLTLCKGNNEFVRNVPLDYFMQTKFTELLRLQNIQFDLDKSFIELLSTPTDFNSGYNTVFFNVVIDGNK